MSTRTYRLYALFRWQLLGTFGLMAAISLDMLVSIAVGAEGGPPVAFTLCFAAVLCWNGYWFLFRVAYRLDLDDDVLRWHAPVRSGVIQVVDLVEMRPARLIRQVEVIRTRSGGSVLVWTRKGFKDFTRQIQAAAPQVTVELSLMTHLRERLPGSRRFRD